MIHALIHDQRAPLSMLAGYAELLATGAFGPLNDEQEKATKIIQEVVGQLIKLNNFVMDDLTILNLSHKRRDLDLGRIEIEEWLIGITKRFAKALEAKNQQIILDIPKSQYTKSDPYRCSMLISYLIDNPSKYSEHGSQITITSKSRLKDILITITDNGIGIAEDEQPHIFTKWFKGQHEIVRKAEGFGSGLYFAKRLAQVLGSELGFESTEGSGDKGGLGHQKKHDPIQPRRGHHRFCCCSSRIGPRDW